MKDGVQLCCGKVKEHLPIPAGSSSSLHFSCLEVIKGIWWHCLLGVTTASGSSCFWAPEPPVIHCSFTYRNKISHPLYNYVFVCLFSHSFAIQICFPLLESKTLLGTVNFAPELLSSSPKPSHEPCHHGKCLDFRKNFNVNSLGQNDSKIMN